MVRSAKSEIDGAMRLLTLEPRSRVLDLGCGAGRRTLEIARRGHRVLGVDADEAALAHARDAAKGERLNLHYQLADVRAVSYRAEFDAVTCLDGAFGRLPADRDDQRMLETARRGLKPGGRLLLDVVNRERLIRDFPPGCSFDLERGRLLEARGPSLRAYALTEITAMLKAVGLSYLCSLGGYDGSTYALDSPRLLVLAERSRDERPPRHQARHDGLPKAIRIRGRS